MDPFTDTTVTKKTGNYAATAPAFLAHRHTLLSTSMFQGHIPAPEILRLC